MRRAPETSTTETVSITVNPVNDVPQASPTSVSLDEDASLAIDFGALVSDVETADANLLLDDRDPAGARRPDRGSAFLPDPDFNGAGGWPRVTDRGGYPDDCGAPGPGCDGPEISTTETVSITVDAVNDAPEIVLPVGR